MGRRKPFIDKKSATTYSLLYGEQDDQHQANEGLRSSDEPELQTGMGLVPSAPKELTWDLSPRKRKEIFELGLPDDGYDYLQHLKDPATITASSQNANAPAAEGPRVFLPAPYLEPPPEDIKYVDARSLPQQVAPSDGDILQVLGGVAPFARDLDEQPSQRANDVDALTELMRELENADDIDEHGTGDLLDDFVSTAAAKVTFNERDTSKGTHPDNDEEEDRLSNYSGSSEDSDDDGHESRLGRAYVGSIASTYWRPERTDRGALSTVDERFEQLALEYDSDELGELDDVEGGGAGFGLLESTLQTCIAEQSVRMPLIEGPHSAQAPLPAGNHRQGDADRRIAIEKARELLHASLLDEGVDVVPTAHDERLPTKAWDCESVLSMQTNLDNHPSLLEEPSSSRKSVSRASTSLSAERTAPAGDNERSSSGEYEETERYRTATGKEVLQRKKGESPEEKKQRKEQVRLAKREARVLKKDTKTMHKINRCRVASNVGPSQRIVPLSS